jgi:hypothetical protein
MDATYKSFLESGRHLVMDTKTPRKVGTKPPPIAMTGGGPGSDDPHRVFVKSTISGKPKKADLVKDIEKFIKQAEASL